MSIVRDRSKKVRYDERIRDSNVHLVYMSIRIKYLSLKREGESRSEDKELENKNNYSFPSYLTGMSIKLGGRTFKQRIVPRMTQKRIQKGTLNKKNVLFLDRARFISKTKKGTYNFTVKMGHAF